MLKFKEPLRRLQSLVRDSAGLKLSAALLALLGGAQTIVLAALGTASLRAPTLIGLGVLSGFLLRVSHQIATDFLFQSHARAGLISAYDRLFGSARSLFSRHSGADLLQQLGADFPAYLEAKFYARLEIVAGLVSSAVALTALAYWAPARLAPLAFIGLVAVLLAQGARRILRSITAKQSALSAEIFRKEKNLVEGIDYLRVSSRYPDLRAELSALLGGRARLQRQFALVDNLVASSHWGIRYFLVLGFASILVIPVGLDAKNIFWLYLLLGAASQVGWGWQKLRLAEAHVERCRPVVATPPDSPQATASRDLSLRASGLMIRFNPRAEAHEPCDLGPLHFSWTAGDRIWIEGQSGAGKTTLVRALLGLHPFLNGSVELPATVGHVPQHPFFFEGESVAYNLGGGELDFDLLGALGLETFVQKLPQGISTILGAEGVNPSRGQRVRLAVYRELRRKPALLILDEPLAGLDRVLGAALIKVCRLLMADGILCVCDHRAEAREWLNPTQTLSLGGKQEAAWTSATC